MAKIEKFRTFLTSKGVDTVTVDTQMAVMDALNGSDMTIRQIQDVTGLSPSNLYYVLESLAERRLIASYREHGSVVYSAGCSVLLTASVAPDPDALNVAHSIALRIHSDWNALIQSLKDIIVLHARSIGIDIQPMFLLAGRILYHRNPDSFRFRDVGEFYSAIGRFRELSSSNISVVSYNPMRLAVIPKYPIDGEAQVLGNPNMGFILQALAHNTGRRYRVTSWETGSILKIDLRPETADSSSIVLDGSALEGMEDPCSVPMDVGVVLTDDGPAVLSSKHIAILRSVEGGARLQKIIDDTGMAKTTAFNNINTLCEEGFTESYEESGSVMYRSRSRVLFEPIGILPQRDLRNIPGFGSDNYYFYVMDTVVNMFRWMRLDISGLFFEAGRMMGSVLDDPDRDAADVLKDITRPVSDMFRIGMVSLIPLRVSLTFDPLVSDGSRDSIRTFVRGVVSEVLSRRAGCDRPITLNMAGEEIVYEEGSR